MVLFDKGWTLRYPLPDGWPEPARAVAAEGNEGHFWLAAVQGSLARLINGRFSMVSPVKRSGTAHSKSYVFSEDFHDSHGGVWHCEHEFSARTDFRHYLILPFGVEPRRIDFNMILEDREGNIWVATNGKGLCRLRSQQITAYSQPQGLPSPNVYSIFQSSDSTIWIGTWGGGLCSFKDGKFKKYSGRDRSQSNQVESIFEDRDRVLWVGFANGLYRWTNGWLAPFSTNNLLPVSAMNQDAEGNMWFGTSEGLQRLEHGHWTTLTTKDGLASDDTRVIVKSRGGGLWIGGYGGLTLWRDGEFRAWTDKDGLAGNSIRSLYEDPAGVLWIGTYDAGLGRFEKGRFTTYRVREGLFDDGVFQILEDSRGYLWMSCNRGIYKVNKEQLNDFAAGKVHSIDSIAYGRQDGMRNVECNGGISPAGVKTSDGKLWFPTQDGVAVVDPPENGFH